MLVQGGLIQILPWKRKSVSASELQQLQHMVLSLKTMSVSGIAVCCAYCVHCCCSVCGQIGPVTRDTNLNEFRRHRSVQSGEFDNVGLHCLYKATARHSMQSATSLRPMSSCPWLNLTRSTLTHDNSLLDMCVTIYFAPDP